MTRSRTFGIGGEAASRADLGGRRGAARRDPFVVAGQPPRGTGPLRPRARRGRRCAASCRSCVPRLPNRHGRRDPSPAPAAFPICALLLDRAWRDRPRRCRLAHGARRRTTIGGRQRPLARIDCRHEDAHAKASRGSARAPVGGTPRACARAARRNGARRTTSTKRSMRSRRAHTLVDRRSPPTMAMRSSGAQRKHEAVRCQGSRGTRSNGTSRSDPIPACGGARALRRGPNAVGGTPARRRSIPAPACISRRAGGHARRRLRARDVHRLASTDIDTNDYSPRSTP